MHDATTPDAATKINEPNVRHVGLFRELLKFSVSPRRTRRKSLKENIHIISDEASDVICACGDVATVRREGVRKRHSEEFVASRAKSIVHRTFRAPADGACDR